MLAFALRSAGWYLRQDIIWEKPNAMPESVTDRCTKSHEYIFLLSKSKTYFYDADAIREPFTYPDRTYNSGTSKHKTAHLVEQGNRSTAGLHDGRTQYGDPTKGRNKRSVWTVTTSPYKGAHFATFPTKLIEPCVLAGCPKGGTVLDPFSGSGTTGVVALSNERNYIGIELNPEYVELSHTRIQKAVPLFITKPVQKMDELEEVAC
jgi:DNA modification methylase